MRTIEQNKFIVEYFACQGSSERTSILHLRDKFSQYIDDGTLIFCAGDCDLRKDGIFDAVNRVVAIAEHRIRFPHRDVALVHLKDKLSAGELFRRRSEITLSSASSELYLGTISHYAAKSKAKLPPDGLGLSSHEAPGLTSSSPAGPTLENGPFGCEPPIATSTPTRAAESPRKSRSFKRLFELYRRLLRRMHCPTVGDEAMAPVTRAGSVWTEKSKLREEDLRILPGQLAFHRREFPLRRTAALALSLIFAAVAGRMIPSASFIGVVAIFGVFLLATVGRNSPIFRSEKHKLWRMVLTILGLTTLGVSTLSFTNIAGRINVACSEVFGVELSIESVFASLFALSLSLSVISVFLCGGQRKSLWYRASSAFLFLLGLTVTAEHFGLIHLPYEWFFEELYRLRGYLISCIALPSLIYAFLLSRRNRSSVFIPAVQLQFRPREDPRPILEFSARSFSLLIESTVYYVVVGLNAIMSGLSRVKHLLAALLGIASIMPISHGSIRAYKVTLAHVFGVLFACVVPWIYQSAVEEVGGVVPYLTNSFTSFLWCLCALLAAAGMMFGVNVDQNLSFVMRCRNVVTHYAIHAGAIVGVASCGAWVVGAVLSRFDEHSHLWNPGLICVGIGALFAAKTLIRLKAAALANVKSS